MSEVRGGLLVVAGHAIYEDGQWHGGHASDVGVYEEHIRKGFELFCIEGYSALAWSGGHTRPGKKLENSEAQGMRGWAFEQGLILPGQNEIIEEFARDSFENVFFSMLAYYKKCGRWPEKVGVVSWKYKAVRYYIIAAGLGLVNGRFIFWGIGDPMNIVAFENAVVSNAEYDSKLVKKGEIYDPFHRAPDFDAKRLDRIDPAIFHHQNNELYMREVRAAYDPDYNPKTKNGGEVSKVIDKIETLKKPGLKWEKIKLPWCK